MTRASRYLQLAILARRPLRYWPRPGYCQCCGSWAWLTNETPAYSAHDGAYICEPCAIENDKDTEEAWREYYSSQGFGYSIK